MESFFRTQAWVQSWLETWGKSAGITLIDLGGRQRPLEMLYTINHRIKGIVPVRSLVVAGYGFADFCPPRAEYNNLDSLISLAGGMDPLMRSLSTLHWDQFAITDIAEEDAGIILRGESIDRLHKVRYQDELAYRIAPMSFELYKAQLGASTRAKYFNQRRKLANYGEVEIREIEQPLIFFKVLNNFHLGRWGKPCYSSSTINFFTLFIERLRNEGGVAILQALQINGEIVSVLFDIVWKSVRYNLQSGYHEGRFGQIALGSLHLGFAIEQALKNGWAYDFLAGNGKHTNYKQKIATETMSMTNICFARGWLKHLYKIYGK